MISSVRYGDNPTAPKTFEYDDSGELIKQSNSEGIITFDYSHGKIIRHRRTQKQGWDAKTGYITDDSGRITSCIILLRCTFL